MMCVRRTVFTCEELGEHLSLVVWCVSGVAGALVTWLPRGGGARALLASAAVRFMYSAGPEPTLWALAMLTVSTFVIVILEYYYILP